MEAVACGETPAGLKPVGFRASHLGRGRSLPITHFMAEIGRRVFGQGFHSPRYVIAFSRALIETPSLLLLAASLPASFEHVFHVRESRIHCSSKPLPAQT